MIINWLAKQVLSNTQQWDLSLTNFYPSTRLWMSNPESYVNHLTVECNYLNAAKCINFNSYLSDNAHVLDVGCGGGWLTGYLSSFSRISSIMAIDTSANYLHEFLPKVVNIMNGNQHKVQRVQALFSPLLLKSKSIDLIVISSALHHADSMGNVLREFSRVLKSNGKLIILNETPRSNFRFCLQMFKSFLYIFSSTLLRSYVEFPQELSAGCHLYDPYLGDHDYPLWYWKKAIKSNGFKKIETINTNLSTKVNVKGRSLYCFICHNN